MLCDRFLCELSLGLCGCVHAILQMSLSNSSPLTDLISEDIEAHLNAQAELEEAEIGRLRVSQEGLVSQLDALLKGARSCTVSTQLWGFQAPCCHVPLLAIHMYYDQP